MSDYTKTTQFSNKTSADTIEGFDFDSEFILMDLVFKSKADKPSRVSQGDIAVSNLLGNLLSGETGLEGSLKYDVNPETFLSVTLKEDEKWMLFSSTTLATANASRGTFSIQRNSSGGVLDKVMEVFAKPFESSKGMNQLTRVGSWRDGYDGSLTVWGGALFETKVKDGKFYVAVKSSLGSSNSSFMIKLLGWVQ